MENSKYFLHVKAFPNISDNEIEEFANHIMGVAENPSNALLDSVNFYFQSRKDEGIPIVPSKEHQTVKPFDFFPMQFKHIPDLHHFSFLDEVFAGIEVAQRAAFIFRGGKALYPHTDRSHRRHVVNFPIKNAFTSRTCFFEIEDSSLEFRPSWCYPTGVKKVAELQYEPKTLSALCVQQIHSVEAVKEDIRIVLSASIDNNQRFSEILRQLKQ